MNNELFNQAQSLYQAKDYQGALKAFAQCVPSGGLNPGETGLVYHQIGNCLVKMKRPQDAIKAYEQAQTDSYYTAVGSVCYNEGMAFASLQDYDNAVACFQKAVVDTAYDAPYKAYLAMGNALMKQGKSAEAGVAFREAALDARNDDPTKALINLGVCFMALNRPADAVSSYESALQFPMNAETRNKLYANLGQAYMATNQVQKAVGAFEQAIADQTYFLSDSASVDYQRAVAALAQGTAAMQPVTSNIDTSGLDVSTTGVLDDEPANNDNPYYYYDEYQQDDYASGEDRFLNATDEELEQFSRGVAKQERKRKNVGLKILVTIIILLILLLGAAVFAYTQGYGFPMQEAVVQQLFDNPAGAQDTVLSSGVTADKAKSISTLVPQDSGAVVNGVDRGMSDSVAYVTAKTPEGGQADYKVYLVREGLGWKVSSVELYFASQN